MKMRLQSGYAFIGVVILLFGSIPGAGAQNQVSFRQLSVKQGLSQNSCVSITQDSTGYLWIATQDGLNKYDGKQFTIYPFRFTDITAPEYSDLGKVYTDREGHVWIIPADNRLRKYDPVLDSFEFVTDLQSVQLIFQDREKNYWIAVKGVGLYRMNPLNQSVHLELGSADIGGEVYHIGEKDPYTLILTTSSRILEIDTETGIYSGFDPVAPDGSPISVNFSSSTVSPDGTEWFGSYGAGLFFRERDSDVFRRIADLSYQGTIPEDLNILSLFTDSSGRLWVTTYGSGLYLVHHGQRIIRHFDIDKHNPRALHYKDVLCAFEDYTGTLWFGTDGAGLSYYDAFLEKFNSFTQNQTPVNINIDVVRAIEVARDRTVWIGTSGKGLTRYRPQQQEWKTFKKGDGPLNALPSNRVMSLFMDADEDLWIGTQEGGLALMDSRGNFRTLLGPGTEAPQMKTIWDIYRDHKGRHWLATRENGLVEFDKKRGILRAFRREPGNSNTIGSDNIRVITEDDQGRLWIGTENAGVSCLNPETGAFRNYRAGEGTTSLTSNGIKSLYYDTRGILWIGTNGGGLNALELATDRFYNYDSNDGLANDVIYGILPDLQGNLWLSSNRGITKFTPPEMWEDPPGVVNYTNYAGLATEFNTGAYFADDRGNLYFGGLEGFYWFRPEEITQNRSIPRTAITKFQVLDEDVNQNQPLKLKYNQNTVSFEFSSLQFSLPERSQYKYRLFDYEKDWVPAGNKKYVRYTRLPPGTYRFEVISSNYDEVWNETPASLEFSIASPWYWSPLSQGIYLLLLVGSVVLLYRYLKWRWKIQLDLKLRKEEAERFKQLVDFKSKLYTDISHEFRTPLSLLSAPLEQKLGQGNLSDSDFGIFSMMKRNVDRLLSLVNQMLDLARLDSGRLKLRIGENRLDLFLKVISASFLYKAEVQRIRFSRQVHISENVWYDEDVMEKIVTNLLSNAVKYCPENGYCLFEAEIEGDYVCIRVANTVRNLEGLDLEKIFERFYQQNDQRDGSGIGLSLVRELVKLHRGTIEVSVREKQLLEFTVRIPKDRKAYRKIELLPEAKSNPFEGRVDSGPGEGIPVGPERKETELPVLLLVEDDLDMRAYISDLLREVYQVREAGNGAEGIDLALKIIPDIVVSDVRMPLKDGIALCNSLKHDIRTSHIPVILLTGLSGEENELKGLRSGADDFVSKPFRNKVLKAKIANLLENRKSLRRRFRKEFLLKPRELAVSSTEEVFLNKVKQILDEHLQDPRFNASMFSEKAGMSRMQLHRKLQAYTGLSTTAFIRSQRLKQAAELLRASDATVSEVAYQVGFNSPSYFTKCFKEFYKCTPASFMEDQGKEPLLKRP